MNVWLFHLQRRDGEQSRLVVMTHNLSLGVPGRAKACGPERCSEPRPSHLTSECARVRLSDDCRGFARITQRVSEYSFGMERDKRLGVCRTAASCAPFGPPLRLLSRKQFHCSYTNFHKPHRCCLTFRPRQRWRGLLAKHLMHKGHGNRSFAHGRRDSLDVATAHVADRKDARSVCFEQVRLPCKRPIRARQVF